jgi:hypothetical protein
VALDLSHQTWNAGTDTDDAYDFISGLGPVQMMLEGLDEAMKTQGLDNLRATIAAHQTPDGIRFGSASWVVTAIRR